MSNSPFSVPVQPDWRELEACILRKGMPGRVHYIELFLDYEVQEAITERYDLAAGLDRGDPYFALKRHVLLQRFLGYDHVIGWPEGMDLTFNRSVTDDTAALGRATGRAYMDEHRGPISNWAEFEAYPWPDPAKMTTYMLEWYEKNLPEDMCVIAFRGFGHLLEHLTWLMGYETLCYALYDQRDLVAAIAERVNALSEAALKCVLQFERVRIAWGSDDMGFRSGTLIAPKDLREFVLPGHRRLAQLAHDAGRPYILHSCGNLTTIMPDLIDDVCIDAKHSFEDVIEPVTVAKEKYGDRIALLGGIDVDFICRAEQAAVRQRVRDTLDRCLPGGGYVLGTGNSVTNYIPLDNYLAMLDEGRRYTA
jgi:uroporphyrinogen decarboxylase